MWPQRVGWGLGMALSTASSCSVFMLGTSNWGGLKEKSVKLCVFADLDPGLAAGGVGGLRAGQDRAGHARGRRSSRVYLGAVPDVKGLGSLRAQALERHLQASRMRLEHPDV